MTRDANPKRCGTCRYWRALEWGELGSCHCPCEIVRPPDAPASIRLPVERMLRMAMAGGEGAKCVRWTERERETP